MLYPSNQTPYKESLGWSLVIAAPLSFILMSSLALLILFIPALAEAQQPCGDIIIEYDGQDERTPIDDCDDPFGELQSSEVVEYAYSIDGIALEEGEVREVEALPVSVSLQSELPNEPTSNSFVLYRHEGQDYRQVDVRYLTGPGAVDLTVQATGTYSIVTSVDPVYMQTYRTPSLKTRFLELFIPTAYAQFSLSSLRSVLTFTINLPPVEPEPTGASNILFIPGIMGSKLYEQSAECDDEMDEQERWVSFDSCNQLRLRTNYLGQSLNTIYTYATENALVDEIAVSLGQGPNIYKSFLADLERWKDDEDINDFAVLPYDWRLKIDDLMKLHRDAITNKIAVDSDVALNQSYLYETISRLAQSAQNEKVTIVAHSNGGLLIKYFIELLVEADDPLLDRIQNIILVAVPQEGTPESIIGSLHGVELGFGGIVMDSQTSRALMKDAPFGFHLLPTRHYFDAVDTPVIQIEEGMATNDWLQQFGDTLNSYDEMRAFISEGSGRVEPAESDVATPAVLKNNAFTYKSSLEAVLADWQPPEGITVYQVAGTGIDTPSGLTYFTDIACVEKNIFFQCISYERKLGYRVNGVLDGDGTVVTASALSLVENDSVRRLWVNIDEFNQTNIDKMHRDIMEVEDIKKFILDIAASSSDPSYTYLSASSPNLGNGNRLIFQLHSPLEMSVELANGKVVGSSSEIVDGAIYRRFGELQYLSIPASEEDVVLKLDGKAEGSFTLDVEEVSDGEVIRRKTYSAIPTATSTQVEVPIGSVSDIDTLVLEVDYDGDGVTDVSYNTEGVVVDEITYEDLFAAIKDLSLNKNFEKVLFGTAKTAEKLHDKSLTQAKYKKIEVATLQVLKKQLEVYEKMRLITRTQREKVEGIINYLISK